MNSVTDIIPMPGAKLAATRGKRFANWKILTSDRGGHEVTRGFAGLAAIQYFSLKTMRYATSPQGWRALARALRLGKRLYAIRNP